jgi:hypothetical protein
LALSASAPQRKDIREHAYAIWEEDGRSDDKHLDHRRRAEDEINSLAEAERKKAIGRAANRPGRYI